jgi:two-component system sensor histidine kinase AtoS
MNESSEKNRPRYSDPLVHALDSFNITISSLGTSYRDLKSRIEELNVQISEKNQQLEENFYKVNRLRWFFDSILNSMTNGVIVIDTSGKIVLFNKGAEKLTGYTQKDIIGKSYKKVFGKKLSDRFTPLHTLARGDSLFLEEKELEKKSGDFLQVRYSTSLVTDNQDQILGAVEVFSDLTRIKHLEKEMQQIKTQGALNQMAGLVAHEIRNPLGGIRGYIDLLEESIDKKDTRRKMTDHIIQSVNKLEEIVSNFLLYTRPVKPCFEKIHIVRFVKDVLNYFEQSNPLKKEGIRLELEAPSEIQSVQISMDPMLIEQVLLAVLDNAIKAMKIGGTVKVEIKHNESPGNAKQSHVMIAISDSGEGMTDEVLDQIFTPFFTSRERGMGLGLSLSRNFISLHQGDIFVKSEKNMGTTVSISLPNH